MDREIGKDFLRTSFKTCELEIKNINKISPIRDYKDFAVAKVITDIADFGSNRIIQSRPRDFAETTRTVMAFHSETVGDLNKDLALLIEPPDLLVSRLWRPCGGMYIVTDRFRIGFNPRFVDESHFEDIEDQLRLNYPDESISAKLRNMGEEIVQKLNDFVTWVILH